MAAEISSSPTYDLTTAIPSKIVAGDILNVPYSGREISINLPKGKYKLECWGAQGGKSEAHSKDGGNGGYSKGELTVRTSGLEIFIYVGGRGNTGSYSVYGGWNGGGGVTSQYNSGGSGNHLGTGGGATDICTVRSNVTPDNYYRYVRTAESYSSRIIVAGGGGGAEAVAGTAGGGTSGVGDYAGTQNNAGKAYINDAGSWVSLYDGGFGFGCSTTGGHTNHAMGSCGGGGYYGGGCYANNGQGAYGCGGSGYISPLLSNANTASGNTSFLSPAGSSETGHTGDGYVRITVIEVQQPTKFYLKINGVWTVVA